MNVSVQSLLSVAIRIDAPLGLILPAAAASGLPTGDGDVLVSFIFTFPLYFLIPTGDKDTPGIPDTSNTSNFITSVSRNRSVVGAGAVGVG